ncbi:sigma-70 family RNA polymerase sigma factor [Solihabitans fulvus]|uniref:Sigma-70 family RNA polymerase sigma factor n=1 Tax=Solihabitans fulvus TaxID=1892852 RepID=A0A5B2XDC3_9PSEU|nr:sigma-70 family RNA polymerase sigma factor [Solihabitans fulvus]KAA2261020.1 sigma-70 family RNA polymerase sigma factor [Solihabitans fulvus]
MLRYATVLSCDPYLAQDIVQEVLLRAQQRWPRISSANVPAAYVHRMITNEYLSWRRRRAVREVALTHQALDVVTAPFADPTAGYDERDAMLAAIARLPRKQRAAVVLRYYEGYDNAAIAAAFGCGEGTVRSHISRALATLRAANIRQPTVRSGEGL